MVNNNKEKCYLFCTNNQFTLLEEQKLTIYRFFDISKKKEYSLLLKDNTLYTIIQLNTFGSIFVGNYLMDPNVFIVTQIDPLIIIVSIMYVTTHNLYEISPRFIKKEDACTHYLQIMEKLNIDESYISQTKETFISIINPLLSRLEVTKICDSIYNDYLKEEMFRFNLEKAFLFIESKLSKSEDCLDKKLDVTKILSFINEDLSELYLKNKGKFNDKKGIDLSIQKEEIMEEKKDLKRVNEEKNTKKPKKPKKDLEVPYNQKSINTFFIKK